MFSRVAAIAVTVVSIAWASPLLAQDYSFQFVDTSNATLASGFLTVDPTVNVISPFGTGPFQSNTITALTGTYLGETITFSVNPNAPGIFQVGNFVGDDQLLINAGTLLDETGIIFSTPSASVNIFGFGQGGYLLVANQAQFEGTFSISQVAANVPEPSTWAMMILGFGAVGLGMRRRKQTGRAFPRAA